MPAKSFVRTFQVFSRTLGHLKAADSCTLSQAEQKWAWANDMLQLLNIELTVIGEPTKVRPAIFVGNHIGYIDIPLLMSAVPEISFVAKEELAGWPVFGEGAKRMDTIFVKRESPTSRGAARASLVHAITEQRKAMVIFPSGTTSLAESTAWKLGAFRLAEDTGAILQPFRLSYHPLRTAAFIDDDSFLIHLLKTCATKSIRATLEFAAPEKVSHPLAACESWRRWASASPSPLSPRGDM